MIRPALWREFLKPSYRRLFEAAHSRVPEAVKRRGRSLLEGAHCTLEPRLDFPSRSGYVTARVTVSGAEPGC